jgi:AcrR family transcriptional regulator
MSTTADRPLRADAVRNADKVLQAAREAYSELGPDVPMDVIASRAGVGERTLYRHFPSKAELVRAVLDQSIAEHLTPVIEHALADPDALRGITEIMETATQLGAREHHILVAARGADALSNISLPLEQALGQLAARAKRAGQVRDDLAAEDLPRLFMMLNSVLWTMDPTSGGWQRYVALILDAISTAGPSALPPAVPMRTSTSLESWPL